LVLFRILPPQNKSLLSGCVIRKGASSLKDALHWDRNYYNNKCDAQYTQNYFERTGSHRTIETRTFKNFNHHHFLDDVAQQPWNRILSETNPEAMWDVWKNLFMEVVDKHAPLQSKRFSNKHSPWITYELTRKIHKRNYMKKSAAS